MALAATIAIFVVAGPIGAVLPGPAGRSVSSILAHADRSSMQSVIEEIPSDASVSGGTYLLAHLAQNPDIKPFPGPLVCSPVLLTWYPQTYFPDYVVVEQHDLDVGGINLEEYGYEMIKADQGVKVWRSTGDHPEPMTCPGVEEARRGLFERVERSARR